VWSGITLHDDVFVGPNATFCNDKFPRANVHLKVYPPTVVESGASLGANCTILPGIKIGTSSMVGAGSVVTHDVSPKTVVAGNPARFLRFVDAVGTSSLEHPGKKAALTVKGAKVLTLPTFRDRRGCLSFAEYESHLPWVPKRFFTITGVPQNELRGYHAHKSVKQFLVCLAGQVSVLVDDGTARETVVLDSPGEGLLLEPMVWSSQSYVNVGCVLLVLCSEKHNPNGYVHDYSQFLSLVAQDVAITDVVPFLNVKAAAVCSESELRNAFERVLESGQFVGGAEVSLFEREWADYCRSSYCVGVGSGLAALHLMLLAAGIQEGDEVIVPANTYIATLLAVSMTGARCVLVEPRKETRVMDESLLDGAFTCKTRAVLSCDLYGTPVDYKAISEWARKKGVFFFSDAAQSHGALYHGTVVGSDSLCDGTCFSFYPSKNLGALGEAGAITTPHKNIAERVQLLRNYGSRVRYLNEEKGFNERLDPLQAAFLRVKLKKLDELNARRSMIADLYHQAFQNLPWITLPTVHKDFSSNHHLFVVACEKRDLLQSHLKDNAIESMVHYPVPPHLSQAYKEFQGCLFPITEELSRTVLSLPICPFLTKEQVLRVISAVCSFQN
jgi:dTDP-4-amino-4,6-dideoxygalactose transaminase/dTDP-4-dehydrorhamnose 3,5-epimerase-like enzyme